jgi:hypothetical protein
MKKKADGGGERQRSGFSNSVVVRLLASRVPWPTPPAPSRRLSCLGFGRQHFPSWESRRPLAPDWAFGAESEVVALYTGTKGIRRDHWSDESQPSRDFAVPARSELHLVIGIRIPFNARLRGAPHLDPLGFSCHLPHIPTGTEPSRLPPDSFRACLHVQREGDRHLQPVIPARRASRL